jgi:hypothetical protein
LGSRWGCFACVLVASLSLAAGSATAAPPVLTSVGHVYRHPTAIWTLPAQAEAAEIEVATSPTTRADGSFVGANVVDWAFLNGRATTWRSPRELQRGGRFYVHVAASDYGCAECVDPEWSNVLSFVLRRPPPLLIRSDVSLAGFRVKANGRLSGAIRALGQPSSRTYLWSGEGCRVRWSSRGVNMTFNNLGRADPRSGRYGHFMDAVMTGPRWQTSKGLRIGSPRARLRRLYPRAQLRGGWWWLVTRQSLYGSGGTYPGLAAQVRNGRVTQFVVSYPRRWRLARLDVPTQPQRRAEHVILQPTS